MAFPVNSRYFIRFRHTDTGLSPVFTYFKRTDTLADLAQPTIHEVANGTYYFDWTFDTKDSPDVVFEIDGGSSIPTEEVRYVADTISPKDHFMDEPISQVHDDVWDDQDDRAAGTKGNMVEAIGSPDDTSASSTLFGKALLYKEAVRGDSAGNNDGNNVKQAYDRLGAPAGATVSADIAAVQSAADTISASQGQYTDLSGANTVFGKIYEAKDAATTSVSNSTSSIKGTGNKDLTQVDTHLDTLGSDIMGLETDVTTAVNNARDSIKGADLRDLTALAGAGFQSTGSLVAISSQVGALVSPDNQGIADILTEVSKIGSVSDVAGAASLFGRIYATRDAVMGSDAVDLTSLAGAGFDTTKQSLKVIAEGPLARILGMMHENSVLDDTTFDAQTNNLESARLRLYDSKENAKAAKDASPAAYMTGMLAQYSIKASYSVANMKTYLVTLEWKVGDP